MFKNGRFQNIEWRTLAGEHKKYWDQLKEKYDLQPPADARISDSLDTIAQRCIRLCSTQLWEEWNKHPLSLNIVSPSLLENYLSAALCDHLIVTFAYRFYCENLEVAPRDRYLRNIQNTAEVYPDASNFHKKYSEYDDNLERIIEKYKILLSEDIRHAEDTLCARQKNLRSVRKSLSLDKSDGEDSVQTKRLDKLTSNALKACRIEKKRLAHQKQIMEKVFDSLTSDYFKNEDSFAPSWIFAFAMATNWKKSPFRVKDNEFAFFDASGKRTTGNQLERLTDFVGNNNWSGLLLKKENKSIPLLSYIPTDSQRNLLFSQTASIMEFRIPSNNLGTAPCSGNWKETNAIVLRASIHPAPGAIPPVNPTGFLGIACDSGGAFPQGLSSQRYELKTMQGNDPPKQGTLTETPAHNSQSGSSKSSVITIRPEIQYVFNSYLLERNFHGYAVSTVINCIASRPPQKLTNEQLEHYVKMIRVTRLHAPLVHGSLILLLAQEITAGRGIDWIESYISYLNTVALPLLEEFFLCSVYHAYSSCSDKDVFSKIEESFLGQDANEDGNIAIAAHLNPVVNIDGFPQITDEAKKILHERATQALRCNRLAYYRLIPRGKNHCSKYSSDCNRLIDRIVTEGYFAGMEGILDATEEELKFCLESPAVFDD